jgi:ABC-type multidrug transport system fused ATPase/permease subunit
MKISESQIEDLYQFTRKHFVYHFDVQTELVDHLANDIEEIWLENPKLSFEEARDKSFKKFGIFGFMDVIEAKQKQMNKHYWKIMWRFVKEWFTLPKVVTTVLIFLVIFSVLKIQFSEFILLGALLILTVFDIINQLKLRKQQKNKEQKQEKIFLLEAMIGQTRNGFSGLAFINFFNLINLTKVSFSSLEIHWVILFYVTGLCNSSKSRRIITRNVSRI